MTIEMLLAKANEIAYSDYHIHAGIDRKATAAKQCDKTYIKINCYTANGKYKGNYKCGCIDDDGNYTVGKYDDVNLDTMEYIGR